MMGDLLEYFEARSRSLDNMEAMSKSNCPLESKYASCIRFNGVPILPPVMTTRRKEEMQTYRRQAMKKENTRKSRHREQLVAKVQSIVAEVEERRAQRPSRSSASSPAGSDTSSSSRLSAPRTRIAYGRTSPTPQRMVQGRVSPSPVSYRDRERVNPATSKTGIPKAQIGKPTKSNLLNVASKIKSKSEQDISKMSEWTVVDQRSAAQNSKMKMAKNDKAVVQKGGKPKIDKTGSSEKKAGQNSTLNNLKRASSMSSLPNPAKIQGIPVPKPPTSPMSRQQQRRAMLGMSGQFSMSNPDLRTIDKSDSETSRSEDSPTHRRKKLQKTSQQSVSDPDITRIGQDSEKKKTTSPKKVPSKESKPSSVTNHGQKSATNKQNDMSSSQLNGNSSVKVASNEREERLDSLTDFPSLEECNSLPQEFGGMPLSSVRQQQISHVLSKLSKCLNIQDTLSTMNSTGSVETNQFNVQQDEKAGSSKNTSTNRQRPQVGTSVTSVQSERDSVSGSNPAYSDASSSSYVQTPPSHNSSGLSSGPSSSAAGNTSYGSSSSTSAVSAGGAQHQRRMSPKGGKSKVHFASFLTEISTSASQSLEGRISVRKMDITPQNSPHVSMDMSDGASKEDCVDGKLSLQIPPKNLYDLGSSDRPQGSNTESMLSKVALSPEESESPTTPGELFNAGGGLPFHGYGMEVENNTSDKENEYHDGQKVISSSGFIESSEIAPSSSQSGRSERNSRIQSVKTSTKSLNSDDGSQCSTLKASQDLLKREMGIDMKSSGEQDTKLSTEEQPVITDAEYNYQRQQLSTTGNVQNQGSKQSGTELQWRSGEQNDTSKDAAKTVFKPGHARKGSYTLQQPSPVLLQAVSQDFTASNGVVTGNTLSRPVQRKLDMDTATQGVQNQITQENISLHSSTEEEGKAEHIQRYLNQVQNHSGGKPTVPSVPKNLSAKMEDIPPPIDISDAIQSFTASLQSIEDMSEEDLLKIQTDHFNRLRNVLIQQQKQQLEELFVHQRREQLKLQDEISSFQQKIKDSQDLSLEHSPLNASHIHPPYPGQGGQQDFAYMASPSLYFNPRDRENNSDISTFSKTTPKQSLQFANHSTPVAQKLQTSHTIPSQETLHTSHWQNAYTSRGNDLAYSPEMKRYFDRVSACVKGYLTRRLIKTEKVQEIIKTIQDTKQFAYKFQAETPIRLGQVSNQDRYLLDRIIAQLQSALLDIHEVFFVIPVWERMSLISQSRQLWEEKRLRESNTTRSSVSSSQPRISSATLKAMERKRRAQYPLTLYNVLHKTLYDYTSV
ncbi:hypothetical protein FSP39_016305 [Pinctada imbricata]|uniref:Uncharacterized protein n=1 Tax=Pinctada imbricata TaxID=66713 RepID=A0AA88XRI5_PINIB|nr:hypothetical protein FSP39_016305 [Pinctada imbricata]